MDLDERKARLLRAVVHEFIYTEKPVGSKSLTERYSLGVSPATIRNELAVLEEQGYLSHPHTSAGRIPTDRGYRYYVDALSGVGELARAQEETIARFFEGAADLEETLQRTSLLLSSLTHYTAMVAPPALDRSKLRHIEVVGLGRRVIMLVLIVDSGRVEKRLVETAEDVAIEDLEDLRRPGRRRLPPLRGLQLGQGRPCQPAQPDLLAPGAVPRPGSGGTRVRRGHPALERQRGARLPRPGPPGAATDRRRGAAGPRPGPFRGAGPAAAHRRRARPGGGPDARGRPRRRRDPRAENGRAPGHRTWAAADRAGHVPAR